MSSDLRPNTAFLLMAQYGGAAIIPLRLVCRDYFSHLTEEKFLRKALAGEIKLPVVRIEGSQKAARGIMLTDLAAYIDKQHEKAVREAQQLSGAAA